MMLDSVFKTKKKYHPQTLLKECKYEPKKVKMENLINDDLEKSSSAESEMSLMMKLNLTTRKIMMKLNLKMINPMNNLLKVKKSILVTIKS